MSQELARQRFHRVSLRCGRGGIVRRAKVVEDDKWPENDGRTLDKPLFLGGGAGFVRSDRRAQLQSTILSFPVRNYFCLNGTARSSLQRDAETEIRFSQERLMPARRSELKFCAKQPRRHNAGRPKEVMLSDYRY